MSVFGRRVTPEQLASDLLRGLESGEIVPDDANESVAERSAVLLADRVTKVVEDALVPLRAQFQALADRAVVVLQQVEESRQRTESETAQTLGEARAVLAEVVRAAELLCGAAGDPKRVSTEKPFYGDKVKEGVYKPRDEMYGKNT